MPTRTLLSRLAPVVPVLLLGPAGLHAAPKPTAPAAPIPRLPFRVDRIPRGVIVPNLRIVPGDAIPPCAMVFDYRVTPYRAKYTGPGKTPRPWLSPPPQHWTFHDGPTPTGR